MRRSRAQKMLPMLMPALAALLRDGVGCAGEGVEGTEGIGVDEGWTALLRDGVGCGGDGVAGVEELGIDEGWTADDRFVAEEGVGDATNDEVVGVISIASEEVIVVEENAIVALWSALVGFRPGPHVCGITPRSDVRLKFGVSPRSFLSWASISI